MPKSFGGGYDRNTIYILGAVIGILVAALVYFVWRNRRESAERRQAEEKYRQIEMERESAEAAQASQATTAAQPTLVLFYANWCGHSQKFMPAWQEIKQHLANSPVQTMELEEASARDEIAQAGVEGFPTIRMYPQGYPKENFVKYSGDRSVESVMNFVMGGGQ